MTTLLVLWALGRAAYKPFIVSALVASVAIDVDHLPSHVGIDWLTAATPRPHTHSLLTIALLLALGSMWRRVRVVALGSALGVTVHFARDLAESGAEVPLLWPWSNHSFTISHGGYVVAMALVVAVGAARCLRLRSTRVAAPPVAGSVGLDGFRCDEA